MEHVRNKYSGVLGIMTLYGHELLPEKWFETIYNNNISKYDVVGTYKDYIIDKFRNKIYYRTINQPKYRSIMNNINFDFVIFTSCMFLKMDFLKKMNWNIYCDNSLTEPKILLKLYSGYPKIGNIDNLNILSVCYNKESSYSIHYMAKNNFFNLAQIDVLPTQEEIMVTRF